MMLLSNMLIQGLFGREMFGAVLASMWPFSKITKSLIQQNSFSTRKIQQQFFTDLKLQFSLWVNPNVLKSSYCCTKQMLNLVGIPKVKF